MSAIGRVEDGRGSLGHAATLRFPSPLIEPDVPISSIRLSDWIHRMSYGIGSHASVSLRRGSQVCLSLTIKLPLKDHDLFRCCQAHRQSPDPLRLRKRSKSRGPSLHRSYTASSVLFPRPTPTAAAALSRRRGRYPRYDGSPPFHGLPSRRAVPTTPADRMSAHVDYFPIRAAFPDSWAGRHPRLHFRGLLGLHSRYGPPGCSTAQSGLCHEASIRPVTQPNRSSATRPIDNYLGGFFLHWLSVPFRGTPAIWG